MSEPYRVENEIPHYEVKTDELGYYFIDNEGRRWEPLAEHYDGEWPGQGACGCESCQRKADYERGATAMRERAVEACKGACCTSCLTDTLASLPTTEGGE